jgi:hypothetical protein
VDANRIRRARSSDSGILLEDCGRVFVLVMSECRYGTTRDEVAHPTSREIHFARFRSPCCHRQGKFNPNQGRTSRFVGESAFGHWATGPKAPRHASHRVDFGGSDGSYDVRTDAPRRTRLRTRCTSVSACN